MPTSSERSEKLSAESTSNAVDVLGMSVKGASGVTVGAGVTTWFSPSSIGLFIAIASFIVTLFLAWKKNKIYNLQMAELEAHRRKDV